MWSKEKTSILINDFQNSTCLRYATMADYKNFVPKRKWERREKKTYNLKTKFYREHRKLNRHRLLSCQCLSETKCKCEHITKCLEISSLSVLTKSLIFPQFHDFVYRCGLTCMNIVQDAEKKTQCNIILFN